MHLWQYGHSLYMCYNLTIGIPSLHVLGDKSHFSNVCIAKWEENLLIELGRRKGGRALMQPLLSVTGTEIPRAPPSLQDSVPGNTQGKPISFPHLSLTLSTSKAALCLQLLCWKWFYRPHGAHLQKTISFLTTPDPAAPLPEALHASPLNEPQQQSFGKNVFSRHIEARAKGHNSSHFLFPGTDAVH